MDVYACKTLLAQCAEWFQGTRAWLACVRSKRRLCLWVHKLIREEGLVQKNERVLRARSAADAELGGARAEPEPARYGFMHAVGVSLVLSFGALLAYMIVYALLYGTTPHEVEIDATLALLEGYTRLLHARHDPIGAPDPVASTEPRVEEVIGDLREEPGPYAMLRARTGMELDALPGVAREPCRRLSRAEITEGITTEGYVLPLLFMRMCELVHELYGCDEDGVIIPKYVQTEDDLNICAITFKEASGVCHHYVNPVVRPVLSTMRNDLVITSPHFEALGEHVIIAHPQILLSYQPILPPRLDPADALAISQAYDALPIPGKGQWLGSLPELQTLTVNEPQSYSYFIAYSALAGDYPAAERRQ